MNASFADKIKMQHLLFAELSTMFGKEVPLYDKSLLVNKECNKTVCALLSQIHGGFTLSDEQLATVIQDSRNELHVLHVAGSPAGFAELDRRVSHEIELVQFGLMADFIGQGLGKWFLQWTIDKAWSYGPKRFWLHTCTLDHPAALPTYKQAGFVQFKEQAIRRER